MEQNSDAFIDIEIDDEEAERPIIPMNEAAPKNITKIESTAKAELQCATVGNADVAVLGDPILNGDVGIVKRIIGKRNLPDGTIEYEIEWAGSDEHGQPYPPSWEPVENLDCPNEVAEFEATLKQNPESEAPVHEISDSNEEEEEQQSSKGRSSRKRAQKRRRTESSASEQSAPPDLTYRGYPVRRILGVKEVEGHLEHCVQWELDDGNFVRTWELASKTMDYCHREVIQYYESKLRIEPVAQAQDSRPRRE